MTDSILDIQVAGSIATLTMNRPGKRNAMCEELLEALGDEDLAGLDAGSRDRGELVESLVDGLREGLGRHVHLLQQPRGEALRLLHEREQQVLGVDLLVSAANALALSGLHGLLALLGQLVEVHIVLS